MDWRKNSIFSFPLSLSEAYILPCTSWPPVHLHLLSFPALELANTNLHKWSFSWPQLPRSLLPSNITFCMIDNTFKNKEEREAGENPLSALGQHRERVTWDIFRTESNGSDVRKAQRKTQLWNLTLGPHVYWEQEQQRNKLRRHSRTEEWGEGMWE